ncbi:uncharacterized protein [Musca autumnalis]|uniref:uncharacterized protein n=1 Tax=Musca autumnalis TaxID=221902 RepID=UPI003CEE0D31
MLFKKYKFGTTIDEVKRENVTATPWASIIYTSPAEEDSNGESIAYIWLEGEMTSIEPNCDIITLILQILCYYYYIFNIEYPKDISQTCEFFMRYLLKFYPLQVIGKKKNINNMKRIITLIKKLYEMN